MRLTTTDKVHDLDPVPIAEDSRIPVRAAHNHSIEFYCNSLNGKFQKS